jgi:hypothetical protein
MGRYSIAKMFRFQENHCGVIGLIVAFRDQAIYFRPRTLVVRLATDSPAGPAKFKV